MAVIILIFDRRHNCHSDRLYRDFLIYANTSISEVKTDAQGRIAIPTKLRDEIGLEREAVLIGVINRLEIWIPNEWNRVEGEPESEITESVWL